MAILKCIGKVFIFAVLLALFIAGNIVWIESNLRVFDPNGAKAQREYLQKNEIPLIEFQPSEKHVEA